MEERIEDDQFPECSFAKRRELVVCRDGSWQPSISIDSKKVSNAGALAELIKLRKGWGRDGSSSDEVILRTFAAWVKIFFFVEEEVVVGEAVKAAKDAALVSVATKKMERAPPRVFLLEREGGCRSVVFVFIKKNVDCGNHGRWDYKFAHEYDIQHGREVDSFQCGGWGDLSAYH